MLHDDEMENEFPTFQDQLDFQNEVKDRENDKQPPASHYENDLGIMPLSEVEKEMKEEGSCYDPDEVRDADYYKRFGLD